MFQQGKKYEQNQKRYKRLIPKQNLDLISITQLNIVDNLKTDKFATYEGLVSMNAVKDKNATEDTKLKALEANFNTTMGLYVNKYKKYLIELTERQSNKSTLRNITIKYKDDYYYVNKSGVARLFPIAAWIAKDQTCPNSSKNLDDKEFQKLTMGSVMNEGELCGISLQNVEDRNSGTAAWIDSQGQKHIYTDFMNRNESCPRDTKKITSTQFANIPTGHKYGSNDKCNMTDLNSGTYNELVTINQRLRDIVTEMHGELNRLLGEDKDLDKKVGAQKKVLAKSYNELTKLKDKLRQQKNAIHQYEAEVTDQNLNVPSVQMHHLIWVILGGAFIATAISNYRNLN